MGIGASRHRRDFICAQAGNGFKKDERIGVELVLRECGVFLCAQAGYTACARNIRRARVRLFDFLAKVWDPMRRLKGWWLGFFAAKSKGFNAANVGMPTTRGRRNRGMARLYRNCPKKTSGKQHKRWNRR
jgi:hypothetical protein